MKSLKAALYSISAVTFISHAFYTHAFLTTTTSWTTSRRFSTNIKTLSSNFNENLLNETLLHDSISGRSLLSDELQILKPNAISTILDPTLLEFVPTTCDFNEELCNLDDFSEDPEVDEDAIYPYVDMIRGSAPYIANHRGELAVIHIPGELLAWDELKDFMNDIALCWLLGMKIVIVVGCRKQIDERLESKFGVDRNERGHTRVTSPEHLRIIEEEAGYARFEVERFLHRSLRCSQLSASVDGNVVSGNFFKGSHFGVVDGVDYMHSGHPRELNVRRVMDYLQDGEIVLMTSMGFTSTGEGVNVNSECLAAFVAASLCANKVVFCSNNGTILRNKETKSTVQNFRLRDAHAILDHFDVNVRQNYLLTVDEENKENLPTGANEMLVKIGWASRAIQDGVERAHIIAPSNGALIEELFTAKQGTGTCISDDSFESVHPDDDSGDTGMSNDILNFLSKEDEPDWPGRRSASTQTFPWKQYRA